MAAEETADAGAARDRSADVVAIERERFGGVKPGSTFFGWVTASGLTGILTSLALAVGIGIGVREVRMNSARQGLAVWLWGIITIVLALLAAAAGAQFNALSNFNGAPNLPDDGSALTISGLIGLAIAVVIPLVGAILGGKAGMKFHRKVDRIGIDYRADF